MKHWWNDNDEREYEVLGWRPVPSATLSIPIPISAGMVSPQVSQVTGKHYTPGASKLRSLRTGQRS
jgi:hypothetical protein